MQILLMWKFGNVKMRNANLQMLLGDKQLEEEI